MKLGDFPMVEALVSTRNHLIGQRDEGKIRIEIDGRMLAPDFTNQVAPAIRLELGRMIHDIEVQLRGLAVDVD